MRHEIIDYWQQQTGGDLAAVDILFFPKNIQEGKYELARLIQKTEKKMILVYAPNGEGGNRLAKIAEEAGIAGEVFSKAHHKLVATNISHYKKDIIDRWLQEGALQYVDATGYWSQPGLFSWDEVDEATKLLLDNLPALEGTGADLGCGYGALSGPLLQLEAIKKLYAVDKDERAIVAYKKNAKGSHEALCLDIQKQSMPFTNLDFVVMNPPFHHASQKADVALGIAFFTRAAEVLRAGGTLWAVANRHLPYEADIAKHFTKLEIVADKDGFKVIKAVK